MAQDKVVYQGPADTLIVGDKAYRRGPGQPDSTFNAEAGLWEVEVPMSEDDARHLVAWGARHRFRIGNRELREASAGESALVAEGATTMPAPGGVATMARSDVILAAPPAPEQPLTEPKGSKSDK